MAKTNWEKQALGIVSCQHSVHVVDQRRLDQNHRWTTQIENIFWDLGLSKRPTGRKTNESCGPWRWTLNEIGRKFYKPKLTQGVMLKARTSQNYSHQLKMPNQKMDTGKDVQWRIHRAPLRWHRAQKSVRRQQQLKNFTIDHRGHNRDTAGTNEFTKPISNSRWRAWQAEEIH